jgi:predicted small secreted protein
MWLRRALCLALVAVCFLLVACANISGGKVIQPELVTRASREPVLAIPNWQPRDRIGDYCPPGKLACTQRYMTDNGWVAFITAVEPNDFNDFNTTETLGHECWHGFGATHK